jgi:16S rRNA (adenine1518-N6/adenine1519-N6)-dimethyltransferase
LKSLKNKSTIRTKNRKPETGNRKPFQVKAKKHLGQHFLKDQNIAKKIVDSLVLNDNAVIEVGPGMGVLTQYLVERFPELFLIEIDNESIEYLKKNYPLLGERLIRGDFLKLELNKLSDKKWSVIGNFPYNISSQILFKVLEQRQMVTHVVGMVQKEVAQRIASPPGSKEYGILSVLLQAFYKVKLLFSVPPGVFIPPPKVNSAVLSLVRNSTVKLDCDETLFFKVVKQAFQTRRKTLRNALKNLNLPEAFQSHELLNKRAEQLSVEEFVFITKQLDQR